MVENHRPLVHERARHDPGTGRHVRRRTPSRARHGDGDELDGDVDDPVGPAGTDTGPTTRTLVVDATAKSLSADRKVVWKDALEHRFAHL